MKLHFVGEPPSMLQNSAAQPPKSTCCRPKRAPQPAEPRRKPNAAIVLKVVVGGPRFTYATLGQEMGPCERYSFIPRRSVSSQMAAVVAMVNVVVVGQNVLVVYKWSSSSPTQTLVSTSEAKLLFGMILNDQYTFYSQGKWKTHQGRLVVSCTSCTNLGGKKENRDCWYSALFLPVIPWHANTSSISWAAMPLKCCKYHSWTLTKYLPSLSLSVSMLSSSCVLICNTGPAFRESPPGVNEIVFYAAKFPI